MPLALAVAISAILHIAAIVAPGLNLPGMTDPDPAPIEARLAPLPKPVPNIVPVQKHQRQPKQSAQPALAAAESVAAPEATELDAEHAGSAIQQETVASAVVAPVAVIAPDASAAITPPAAPPAPPWPRRGRVHYVVTYGEGGFVIGETSLEWHVDGEDYSIRSIAVPRGIAAMFGKVRTLESEGELTDAGLRPREFRDQREGRELETASFDWAANEIVFSRGRSDFLLVPGAQDLVSVFFQLAWLAPGRDIEIGIATSSRFGRWSFEWVGEEDISLAAGRLTTLHLRVRSEGDRTEIWLATAHGGLPVKIRHVDRKGNVFEQAADLLELD